MFKGSFSATLFFKLSAYLIMATLVIIYWIAQAYSHQYPFPNSWVTRVARHYPEYIFFRIATISGGVFVALGWFTNYFYLKSISKEHAFNIKKYFPQVVVVLGLMGTMLLMGSTATIDSGTMKQDWHKPLEVYFFYFTLIAQVLNTIICTLLYSKIKTINYNNLLFKYFIIFLLVVQYIALRLLRLAQKNSVQTFQEWGLMFTIILGYYSMGVDVEDFKFVYESNTIAEKMELNEID